ncbi:B12-binding domain-containing radical SAM protein [Acidobacteria bacterium AH-259-D05]|nr:B12-binding domain-containing radical SAM protein [Acidobacteria bacterium AH-259-D05]
MRILLINPPFTGFGGLEGHGGKAAPLNLAYLASYLREKDPEQIIGILDSEGLDYDFDETEQRIAKFRPDVVGMTMPTPAYVHVIEVAKRVKKLGREIQVVVGGPHPSAFPRECVEEEDNIDYAILGEGEISFYQLIQVLERGGSPESIGGLACRVSGADSVRANPRGQLVQDLDELPFPARDLLPLDKYYPPSTKTVSGQLPGNMITARGCPYQCTYCETQVVWTRKFRFRSPGNVVDEIQECMEKYGIRQFNFHDDIFPMRRDRTIGICKEIQRRKLDISWFCMSRVNFVWEDVMTEMKRAGCRKIMFGLESGDNEVLKIMKKEATVEQAREAFRICRRVGIGTMGSFMLGNIGETEETIRATIDFAKELNPDTVAFFVAVPYPGTEMFRVAAQKGYIRPDVTWADFAVVGKSRAPMELPGLPSSRVRALQAQALKEFYLRPSYILRKALDIRSRFEAKSLLRGAQLLWRLAFSKGEEQVHILKTEVETPARPKASAIM